MSSRARAVGVVAAMVAVVSMGCTDSGEPSSLTKRSTSSSSAAQAVPWMLLDDPRWAVRKANDQPGAVVPPLSWTWYVEFSSFITPNTEASVVLTALPGGRDQADAIIGAGHSEGVSEVKIMGHDGFVLETRNRDGSSAGATLLWSQDGDTWMTFNGTSELTTGEVRALAEHLVVVTDAQWHDAVRAKLFSS